MPIRDDGVNEGENLTLACRNALLNMIELLQERGWTREQAYVISSVAVDLRVSQVVAEQVHREHGDEDGEAGEGGEPPRGPEIEPAPVEHAPPRHHARLHAQA